MEIIGRDLVTEAATAAVKHHHDLVRNRDAESSCELLVAHIFGPNDLHFQIMVPAAERADLVVAAINCALADFFCIRAGDTAVFLGEFEVLLPAVILFDAPACALLDEIAKIFARQFQEPVTANSGRHALIEAVNNLMHMRLNVIEREVCDDQTHATVDVEPDSAG